MTRADSGSRRVHELNAEPAALEYARLVGVAPQALDFALFSAHPLAVRVDERYYVRSIQQANEDLSLTFYCAVENGIVLTAMSTGPLLPNLEAQFRRLHERLGPPLLTIGCDCFLRRLELEVGGDTQATAAFLRSQQVIGFNTYGEQFNGMHINQTFTGVAIGRPAEVSVAELQARVVALEEERHKLQRINQALIGRIESSAAQSDEAYGAFQYSVVLAEQVRERADALSQTMLELKASNQLLSDARLRAETAHQHLLDAIESISDAFVLFDPQQRIVLFNERFRALWVDSRARIGPGMRRAELHRLARSGGLIVEEQRGGDQQTLYRLRDERWLRMSERPTRDGGLAVLYSDVTEIKLSETARREQALAQKSHLLQRAVDNLSQGVAMVGADGVLELWNRRFLELCGLAPIAGHRAFAEVMAESELPLLTPRSQDSQGSPLSAREQRLFDGRVLEIRTHALPTGGFVNTFTDITERYRHAEALRASERWIRLITDQVPALIAYLSDELVYEFTNKVYEWYRWPSGSMLGRCLRDVHGAEHCRRLEPYFERALAGESVTFEIAETALSGEERYMQRSYVPNRQADGRVAGLFVLIRDITERRRTAEALHQAYQNLEQRVRERTAELTTLNDQFKREIHERSQVEARLREAKREAEQANLSKTKFLAAVSHDLLQPLNAARLFTSALQERGSATRDNEALVNNISHSLEDVENLLGTLVDISKLDAGVITRTSPRSSLANCSATWPRSTAR